MKYLCIRNSNKHTFPHTSKTSSLPRIASMNKRENYKYDPLQNNSYYVQENQKLLLTNPKSCFLVISLSYNSQMNLIS